MILLMLVIGINALLPQKKSKTLVAQRFEFHILKFEKKNTRITFTLLDSRELLLEEHSKFC